MKERRNKKQGRREKKGFGKVNVLHDRLREKKINLNKQQTSFLWRVEKCPDARSSVVQLLIFTSKYSVLWIQSWFLFFFLFFFYFLHFEMILTVRQKIPVCSPTLLFYLSLSLLLLFENTEVTGLTAFCKFAGMTLVK